MAMSNDGTMPNGRNSLGGRKPAIPALGGGKGYGGMPPAGTPENADISSGKPSPSPTDDLGTMAAIPPEYGTHMGSTADLTHKTPKQAMRRTIKTNCK